ncbi:MAG: HxsD-like protein [Candidatus Woesearchaeota archaeon]|jgi:hypothetical protein|nr:hypothetical protein [Parcubacteria group bacterium]MDP6547375.1 HxsD-like protein [Candidatus Woesearchaeota archaeon]|tara:strand:- start:9045 stop:9254 length:210 start_codon:yes stop_codon:yes gene_type:complete
MANNIKIRLNNKFYDKETIKTALDDFKEACDGKILNDEIEVKLEPKEAINDLEGEFCNYVLGLIKNRQV